MTLEDGYFVIERKWYAAMKAEKNCVDDEVAKEVYQMQKQNYYKQLEALADCLFPTDLLLKSIEQCN